MSDTTQSDWRGLQQGDYRAFERVYREHATAMLRYGRQFAEPQAVEDAVQSLFVRLWDKRASLNVDAKPRPYLLISLRNDLLRHRKASARQEEYDPQQDDPQHSIEAQIVAQEATTEQRTRLATAIDTLSERERELVTLRFNQGLSYEDIVEVTGISYQSARNTLARAIGKLRKHLGIFFWITLGTTFVLATYQLVNLYPFSA